MNKLNKLILTACVALSFYNGLNAQSKIPQLVGFQAVARDENNKPIIKKPIGVQLTVRQGGPEGTSVYGAYYQDSTNEFGEFTRLLGSKGKMNLPDISDKFSSIPWEKGDMWLVIDYQTSLTGDFKPMAKIQFIAQPYAFASGTAEKLTTSGVTGQILTHDGTNWVAKDAPAVTAPTYAALPDKPNLHSVATSGNFEELKNKPFIPTNTSELNNDAAFGMFVPGMIMPWAGDFSTVPDGWMPCNGSELNKADYPELFDVIQTFYGSGNGTVGSFNLPDFQGMFLRGANNGATFSDGTTRDPDADKRSTYYNGSNYGDKVGSFQKDEVISHNHKITNGSIETGGARDAGGYPTIDGSNLTTSVHPNSIANTGGSETRPRNISVNYIIRVE